MDEDNKKIYGSLNITLNDTENIKTIQSYIDRVLRIKLNDERELVGKFYCTDREKNIVLLDAVEINHGKNHLF